MYLFTCTHCHEELEYDEDITGFKVECTFCSEKFVVEDCVLKEEVASEPAPEPEPDSTPIPTPKPAPEKAAKLEGGSAGPKQSEVKSKKKTRKKRNNSPSSEPLQYAPPEKSKFSFSILIFLAVLGAGGWFGFKWFKEHKQTPLLTAKKQRGIILNESSDNTESTSVLKFDEDSASGDLEEDNSDIQSMPENVDSFESESSEVDAEKVAETQEEPIVPDGPFTATIVFTGSRDIIPPKGDKTEAVLAVIETNKDAVGLTKDDIKVSGGVPLKFRKRNSRLYDLQLRAKYQPGDIIVSIERDSCTDRNGNKLAKRVEARLPVAWAPWYGTAKRYAYIVRGRGGPEAILPIGIGNDNQMVMTWINPGTYHMGSKGPDFGPYAAKHHQKNEDYHKVTITKGFWISSVECTQNQWESIMGNKPSYFKPAEGDDKQLPVENVSWYDVQEFLKKLNKKIPGLNARLPTEAEWEYCCRSGTTTAYYCGPDDILGDAHSRFNLSQQSWYAGNSADWDVKKRTEKIPTNYVDISKLYKDFQFDIEHYKRFAPHHVGLKSKSDWGLGDFSGNVAEWCQDVYVDNLGTGDQVDPLTAKGGSKRVVRGGSWKSAAVDCRSASRVGMDPRKKYNTVGFRFVIPGDVVLSK